MLGDNVNFLERLGMFEFRRSPVVSHLLVRELGRSLLWSGFAAILLLWLLPSRATQAAPGSSPVSGAALQAAGFSKALHTEALRFEYLNKEVHVTSGLAADGVTPRMVAFDDAGKVVDLRDLKRQNAEARYSQFGALEPSFADSLAATDPTDFVEVYLMAPGVWPTPDRERVAEDEEYAKAYEGELKAALEEAHQSLVAALVERGFFPDHVVPRAPMVRALLSPKDLRDLAYDQRVLSIDPDPGLGAPTSADWLYDTQLDQAHDWGFTGNGERLSLILYNRPDDSDDGTNIVVADTASPTGYERDEASWLMGVMRSLDAGMPDEVPALNSGAAPGTTTYAANVQYYPGLDTVEEWSADRLCVVMGFGRVTSAANTTSMSAHDKYIDFVARHWTHRAGAVNYIGSAGNRNHIHPYYEHSEGYYSGADNEHVQNRYYNGLVVGGSKTPIGNDRVNGWWDTEEMYEYSSHENVGGRELPHLVAPAEYVSAGGKTNDGGTGSFRGTSAATSIVAGLAAILIDLQSGLRYSPEAVRAILMATAWRDVDGTPFVIDDNTDDEDGAGQVSAARAVYTASMIEDADGTQGWHGARAYFATDFSLNGFGWYDTSWDVTLQPGETLRAALNWTANTSCSAPPSSCDTPDLDGRFHLYLYQNGWSYVTGSISGDDNSQFIRYVNTGASPMDLTIRVYLWINTADPDVDSTYLGVAWDSLIEGAYLHEDVCDTTSTTLRSVDVSSSKVRRMPALAALENSEYVGVWVDPYSSTSANGDVIAQLFSKDGLPKADDEIEVTTTGSMQWPRVAALDWDRYVIVYENRGTQHVEAAVYDKYLQSSSTENISGTGLSGYDYFPDVAGYHRRRSGAAEDEVLFWTTWVNGSNHSVYIERCQLFGDDVDCDDAEVVADIGTMAADDELFSSVAAAPPQMGAERGGAVVAWTDNGGMNNGNNVGDIYARGYFYPDGPSGSMVATQPFLVSGGGSLTHKFQKPDVVFLNTGVVAIAWFAEYGQARYRLLVPQCVWGGSQWTCSLQAWGSGGGMTDQLACDSSGGLWDCTDSRSRASGFDDYHGRIGLVGMDVAGVPELRIAYSYESGSSLAFVTRHFSVSASGGTPTFLEHLELPGFALKGYGSNNAKVGGAIDLWPECRRDFMALWGACEDDECNPAAGDFWMNAQTRPW